MLITEAQLDPSTDKRKAAIERRLALEAANQPRDTQHASQQPSWWIEQKVQTVKVVTEWLDSLEAEVGPDPRAAGTIEEFVAQLRELRAWAGDPTLRELEKRAGGAGRLPRSSVSDMLCRTDRLPKFDLVTEFVKACGAGNALPAWIAAWHRLKRAQIEARRQAA